MMEFLICSIYVSVCLTPKSKSHPKSTNSYITNIVVILGSQSRESTTFPHRHQVLWESIYPTSPGANCHQTRFGSSETSNTTSIPCIYLTPCILTHWSKVD